MAEPDDMVIPLLREMRAEMNASFAAALVRFDALEKRFDRLDEGLAELRAIVAERIAWKLELLGAMT